MDFSIFAAAALLLGVIFLHELGHALAALLQGQKISGFYLGIPIEIEKKVRWRKQSLKFSTILFRKKFGKEKSFEIGFSWLLLGGAISFEDNLKSLTAWQKTRIYMAGPAINVVAALVGAMIMLGPEPGWQATAAFLRANGEVIRMLFAGNVPLEDLSGPVGVIKITQQIIRADELGVVFMWLFVNTNLALMNMMPIPVLDGGHIVMNFVLEKTGGKGTKVAQYLNIGSFCILMTVLLSLTIRDFL